MLYVTSPSATKSLTPVTITVCGVSALAFVKVRLEGDTVPSLASLEDSPIETSLVGTRFSTTVNVAVRPAPSASVVTSPLAGFTVMPRLEKAGSSLITTASRPDTGTKISSTWIVECSSVSQR